jgi:hypothetical protein
MVRRSLVLLALTACGVNETPPAAPPPIGITCVPNLDGRIDAGEMIPAAGLATPYFIGSGPRSVDVAGSIDPAGHRVWDFTQPASDPRVELAAEPVVAQWFAGDFPGADVAVPLDGDGRLVGVYRHDEQALWLLGVASVDPDPPEGRTLLPYDAPVALLRFPLETGLAFTSVGSITTGTLRGLPYRATDTYQVAVDASGRLVLPDLELTQALRVSTRITLAPDGGAAVTHRQAGFVFECFGEVARATSEPGDPPADFTTAVEVRRLTF